MSDKLRRGFRAAETALAESALVLLVLVPVAEIVARGAFRSTVPGSSAYAQHLTLVAAFLAGAVTSRRRKHLSMALSIPWPERARGPIRAATATLGSALALAFAWSSLSFAVHGFAPGQKAGLLPIRAVAMVMVYGYAVMGAGLIAGLEGVLRRGRLLAVAAVAGTWLAFPAVARLVSGLMAEAPAWLSAAEQASRSFLAAASVPLIVMVVLAAFLGAPLFIVIGGAAWLLFAGHGLPVEIVPDQAYGMLTGYAVAAIPLFTVTGFLLSESRAGERLIRLFKSLFSWCPGGLAVMAVLVCAFFTTFTGASGVTIVALGGLLFGVLTAAGYGRRFTVGLLTAAGSVGLLFPPSLPVIIYGVTAGISIKDMFIGGLLPGAALVAALTALAVVYALRKGVERRRFDTAEALAAIRGATWEILLPAVIVIGYFGLRGAPVRVFAAGLLLLLTLEFLVRVRGQIGRRPFQAAAAHLPAAGLFIPALLMPRTSWPGLWIAGAAAALWIAALETRMPPSNAAAVAVRRAAGRHVVFVTGVLALLAVASSISLTLAECAAVAAFYAFATQVGIHRDLRVRDLHGTLHKALPVIGGTLTVLALANALSLYVIDAEIPAALTAWVHSAVASKVLFLLVLNLGLLVVGSLMDIYSAILVVAPLIIPVGAAFGVHPVHLGIIFLANMELGYLTPPVGLNLYLSSYRFEEPLIRVYRDVQPFLLVHLATVLAVTYLPFLATWLL